MSKIENGRKSVLAPMTGVTEPLEFASCVPMSLKAGLGVDVLKSDIKDIL